MIALLLGSMAWGAPARMDRSDRVELSQAAHFLAGIVDVREHRLVLLDGIVVIGRDRLAVCSGLVDVRPNRVQLLGRRGLLVARDHVWFGGRMLI